MPQVFPFLGNKTLSNDKTEIKFFEIGNSVPYMEYSLYGSIYGIEFLGQNRL